MSESVVRTEPRLEAEIGLSRGDFNLQLSLTVGPGETVALLGPNGAGKSTALRALAGLVPLSRGSIRLGDQLWDDGDTHFTAAQDRAAAIVFQDYRLFPHLSALDNVAFPLRAKGLPRAAARAEASRVMSRLALGDLEGRRPGTLSGGQAQRVALARALASQPRLLLLDEPLAALDASTRLQLRGELRRQLRGFDGPTILVTHDPLEALLLADQLVVLEHGRVVQQGSPSEVARRPSTQYVAQLVGLNLLRGRLAEPRTGRVALARGGALVAVAPQGRDDGTASTTELTSLAPGTNVLVAIAPSAIAIHVHEPDLGSVRNVWCGTVSGLELLSDRVRVAVNGSRGTNPGPDVILDVTPAAVADLDLSPDRAVWLSVKATEVLAYPAPG